MLEAVDKSHAHRVSRLVYKLARECKLDKEKSELIAYASQFHDIGKAAIPLKLLQAKGPLSVQDMNRLKKHVDYGLRMIDHMTGYGADMAREIIATHHERYDGSGYPKGLKAEEIPMCGRIVAICDVFDALVSERSYKRAWSLKEALKYIEDGSGSLFDPFLVRHFLKVV